MKPLKERTILNRIRRWSSSRLLTIDVHDNEKIVEVFSRHYGGTGVVPTWFAKQSMKKTIVDVRRYPRTGECPLVIKVFLEDSPDHQTNITGDVIHGLVNALKSRRGSRT